MKLIIGANGKDLESTIAKRFGHAEYFILYNLEENSFVPYKNEDVNHNHDNLEYFIQNLGVQNFIVGNIGPHAFEKINKFGNTKIYVARSMTVGEAINKFVVNGLKQITEPTMKHSVNDNHSHNHNQHNHHQHNHSDDN